MNMDSFFPYISSNLPDGVLYYALLGLISMAESIALVGLAIPGSSLVLLAGFLSAHGQGKLGGVMIAAALGAFVGDNLSYLMGARLGYRFLRRPVFRKYMGAIRKAEMFFLDHGGKSLFLGRFAGPLRGMTAFMAGSARFSPTRFCLYTLFSCLLWGLAYPGLGRMGAASWRQVQILTGRFSLLLITLTIILFGNALFWSRTVPRLSAHLSTIRTRFHQIWCRWAGKPLLKKCRDRYPQTWQFIADRFSLRHGAGLYLTAGFLCCALFSALFFGLLSTLPILHASDRRFYDLILNHHHPLAGRLLLVLTGMADPVVVIFWGFLLFVWLILKGRTFSAAVILTGTGAGKLLTGLLKSIFNRPRPLPLHPAIMPDSPGFPSEHAFFALLLGGLSVYLALGTLRQWRSRLSLITSASFMALLIGLSRIFLGAHWLSDVLAGWLLAALWLSFLITAMEVRRRLTGETLWHRQWQPPGFDRLVGKAIWAAALSVAGLSIIDHLLFLWSIG